MVSAIPVPTPINDILARNPGSASNEYSAQDIMAHESSSPAGDMMARANVYPAGDIVGRDNSS